MLDFPSPMPNNRGMKLIRSKDRKTANSVTPSGKAARIRNAFGMLSGKDYSCPFATSVCESVCYAGRLEKAFKGFERDMIHNWEVMSQSTPNVMLALLTDMINEFVEDCVKWDAPKRFRIHHDGDLFSQDYADAWATVIRLFPDVQFWIYTRSFGFVGSFADLPNVAVYLSVDSDNANWALSTKRKHPFVKFAVLGKTFDEAKAVTGRGVRCPENNRAIPLISTKGSACNVCGLCVEGRNDVLFSATKK